MMRKFKALKRSSIAKSTPSLNALDYTENGGVREFQSPSSSRFGINYEGDHQIDDDSSVLDGVVDLSVLLPDGRRVRMPIDARTPMMDVLIQITSSNGVNAGGMVLKVPIDRPPGYLHYKPNMPIGKLGCTTVEVVPKATVCDIPRKLAPQGATLPFEPTIRIQVDLPKNQKTFLRVSPRSTLGEIFYRVCEETNLSPPNAYTLRAAKSLSFPLNLDFILGEVGIVDFAIVPASSTLCKSTNDILGTITKMSQEEKEKRKTRRFFGLLKRKPSAPKPGSKIELQKTILNGQSAVEVVALEKPKKTARERPLSVPPGYFESSDGETSSEQFLKRDGMAGKAKKRPAPPPPQINENMKTLPNNSTDNGKDADNAVRSQHARRGSDSSSGYHGSSQPSPNPPTSGDTTGSANSSAQNASGSEKSTFSYKSNISDTPAQHMTTVPKDENVESAAQKKKQKAPLPPEVAVVPEIIIGKASSSPSSPVPVDVEIPPMLMAETTTDTRCSSPATVEELDKNFEEVIEHIQKQISAEDAAAAAVTAEQAQTDLPTFVTCIQRRDSEHKSTIEEASVLEHPAKRVVISEHVFSTSKSNLDDQCEEQVPRTTQKPTNLDEPLAISHSVVRDNWENIANVPQTQNEPTDPLPIKEQAPTALQFQTDGLLMIKQPASEDDVFLDGANSEMEKPAVYEVDDSDYSVMIKGNNKFKRHSLNSTNSAVQAYERKLSYQSNQSNETPTLVMNVKKIENEFRNKTTLETAIPSKKGETKQAGQAASEDGQLVTTKTDLANEIAEERANSTAAVQRLNSIGSTSTETSTPPPIPLVISPGSSSSVRQVSNRAELASPRSNIIYNDPKKDLYPSMTVKSFEEEYYAKSRNVVTSDYVKAIRYGMVAEFSTNKQDREVDKIKIEATIAKRANIIDNSRKWNASTPTSGEPSTNTQSINPSIRKNSIHGSSTSLDQSANATSMRLQREYEKLQAMFADWQSRLKQNESIIDSERKLSPEQALSFQRFQDEMMQQHRYVQELCAKVQQIEKGMATAAEPDLVKMNGSCPRNTIDNISEVGKSLDRQQVVRNITASPESATTSIKKPISHKVNASSEGLLSVRKSMATTAAAENKVRFEEHQQQNSALSSIDRSSGVRPSTLLSGKKASFDQTTSATTGMSFGSSGQQLIGRSPKWSPPLTTSNHGYPNAKFPAKSNVENVAMPVREPRKSVVNTPAFPDMRPMAPQHDQQKGQDKVIVKYSSMHSPLTSMPPTAPPPPPVMPANIPDSKSAQPNSFTKQPPNGAASSMTTPSFKSSTIPKANFANTDPRDDLMASIRNFGGTGRLRKTSVSEQRQ